MKEKENFMKDCKICTLIDPIMIIQSCLTKLNQNFIFDDNKKLHFEKMNNAINRIYRYFLDNKEAK